MRRTLGRCAAVALTAALLATSTPAGATPVHPGPFTGYGFDACEAPSQRTMDVWRETSPFWTVGIYISGANRHCTRQPDLDAAWVRRQTRRGWRLLPITVGPQARCATRHYDITIDQHRRNKYAAARAQGRTEAQQSVRRARRLGIAARSTLWYDIEDFALSGDRCRQSALSFLSAWTHRLHALGFRSGVYSSVASGIAALDYADKVAPGAYEMPDRIWYGWSNGRADTRIKKRWARGGSWRGDRIHQYRLDTRATYGGVTLHIDRNFMKLAGGSVAPRPRAHCGVRVDFPRYRPQVRGDRGGQVRAAQCLLRGEHVFRGRVGLRYDRATARAVRRFQARADLRVTGRLDRRTWTALLAAGPAPLVKIGSARDAVRRVQRALNAAGTPRLEITGVFDRRTARAVRGYQRERRLPRTGVVAADTWRQLRHGRR